MSVPDISVIIPVFNRGELVRYTLESVRRASAGLNVETIVVDDGSTHAAAESIARLGYEPTAVLRQENQGLLFARLAGVRAATGRYLLFLDSDDLVSKDKLRAHVELMDRSGADVSYSDAGRTILAGAFDELTIVRDAVAPVTSDPAEFFIDVQPPPHSPAFRTAYLREVVKAAFFPPSPAYNCVAEIWFYHNAAPRPARVCKAEGVLAISGAHPTGRLTDHWERLAVASVAVMEAFARSCPDTPGTRAARQRVAEKAFRAWRGLPRDFPAIFCERELGVWRRLARTASAARLGGRGFGVLARLLGPERAGRLLRRLRNGPYASCRTLTDEQLSALLTAIPQP